MKKENIKPDKQKYQQVQTNLNVCEISISNVPAEARILRELTSYFAVIKVFFL